MLAVCVDVISICAVRRMNLEDIVSLDCGVNAYRINNVPTLIHYINITLMLQYLIVQIKVELVLHNI